MWRLVNTTFKKMFHNQLKIKSEWLVKIEIKMFTFNRKHTELIIIQGLKNSWHQVTIANRNVDQATRFFKLFPPIFTYQLF